MPSATRLWRARKDALRTRNLGRSFAPAAKLQSCSPAFAGDALLTSIPAASPCEARQPIPLCGAAAGTEAMPRRNFEWQTGEQNSQSLKQVEFELAKAETKCSIKEIKNLFLGMKSRSNFIPLPEAAKTMGLTSNALRKRWAKDPNRIGIKVDGKIYVREAYIRSLPGRPNRTSAADTPPGENIGRKSWLTVDEAARFFSIGKAAINRDIRSGSVPAIYLSSVRHVERVALEAFYSQKAPNTSSEMVSGISYERTQREIIEDAVVEFVDKLPQESKNKIRDRISLEGAVSTKRSVKSRGKS